MICKQKWLGYSKQRKREMNRNVINDTCLMIPGMVQEVLYEV